MRDAVKSCTPAATMRALYEGELGSEAEAYSTVEMSSQNQIHTDFLTAHVPDVYLVESVTGTGAEMMEVEAGVSMDPA